MLPSKRTFEPEKRQLQELNCRLAQYLSRTQQLEQENASLIREINEIRLAQTATWEPNKYKAEMRDLRRMVGQLSLEKSQAEMEREKLWRELQAVQSLCGQQTDVCRDISGELKGCEKELNSAHKTNAELQQRLFQLENECRRLEEAHRQHTEHLRRQMETRVVPIVSQSYRGPLQAAVTVEDVQEYAFGLSEGWVQTFDTYQKKVEEMEQAIKEDQARLSDLQREKMMYASELNKLRTEAEKQGQVQVRLEEELMHMQEKFRVDCGEYQMIIEQLEHERNVMANTIEQKMREHQQLLQVKMDLGLELAAYRALLEGEKVGPQNTHRRANQHQRERIIEIQRSPQSYSPRASASVRQRTDVRYTPAASTFRRSPVPSSGSISPSRVVPISVARHQSPVSRRDMISFTKARATESFSNSSATKDKPDATKTGEKLVQIKSVSQVDKQSLSSKPHSVSICTETASKRNVSEGRENVKASDSSLTDKVRAEPSEKKTLDTVSVEEIIEKVMKPAGLEAKVCTSGDLKVRYHVEKTEQEDGTTKTQIVLESKVEEELDVTEDMSLDKLLSQGVKKVSLEDIKDPATASMIKNLLSGMKGGEDLANKSFNVEITEEPVETHSDDEEIEIGRKLQSSFHEPSSSYFQIEELENAPQDDVVKAMTETDHWKELGQVEDVSRESDLSFMSQDKEPREYFVSTPDDFSESDEGCGITSYGHYGLVDDLSDERYYQDECLPLRATPEESDEYKYTVGGRPSFKEGFPECIIEEEVRVSPIVQESVLEFLREDSLEPKEQLKGALEKLQESVSGQLKEELAYLTKISRESPDKVAVGKLEQSSDDGTMTIVAELNVSQTLEESGLLEEDGDLSEERIMAVLRASDLGLEKTFQSGAGGYSVKISTEEEDRQDEGFAGFTGGENTEKYIRLEPSKQSHSFQMGVQGGSAEGTAEHGQTSQIQETPEKIKEQRIVYLESPSDD